MKPLPTGGKPVWTSCRARAGCGPDDLDYGPDPYDCRPSAARRGTLTGALLAISSIAGLALAIAAFVIGLNAILCGQWLNPR
jgi:hypothetical protein